FSYLPYLIETGHTNPTRVPAAVQEEIYRRTAWAAEIVGIDFGVAKCDFKLTEQYGPTILEMTNRLSGGFDCQYTKPLATGLDLIKATIDLAIGEELDEADLIPAWQRAPRPFHRRGRSRRLAVCRRPGGYRASSTSLCWCSRVMWWSHTCIASPAWALSSPPATPMNRCMRPWIGHYERFALRQWR